MGALVWKVLGTGAAIGAAMVANRLVASAWTAATGKEPPDNPEDPEVSWQQAVGWTVLSEGVVRVARLMATRQAAAYYAKSAGHLPRALQEAEAADDER